MWQVSGRSDITDFEEVVRLDKEYITNWNIGLDIKILLNIKQYVEKKQLSKVVRFYGTTNEVPQILQAMDCFLFPSFFEGLPVVGVEVQAWSIDNITYIPIKRGFMYLTAVIDWYSRCIVGWEVDDTLDTRMVITALKKAFMVAKPIILNSDQGCQFEIV